MKLLNRAKLTGKVYERFNGSLTRLVLNDALQAICDHLSSSIVEQESVTIKNFGTFHKYEYPSRTNIDVHTKELRQTEAFISVRFVSSRILSELINQRREFFNKTD